MNHWIKVDMAYIRCLKVSKESTRSIASTVYNLVLLFSNY